MPESIIKIAIADDHPLVITGLKNTLKPFKHIDIAGLFTTGSDLLNGLARQETDVVLLDIHLPDNNGSDLTRKIRSLYPETKILIVTSLQSMEHVKAMIQYGCMGYLFKSSANEQTLIEAIEQVHKGNLFIEPTIQQTYMRSLLKLKVKTEPKLTRREKEILKLIAEEYTNQEIADQLCLSQRTVEGHRLSLMQKLEAKNTVGLIKAALQMGIII